MEVGSLCKRLLDCVEEFYVKFVVDPIYNLSELGGRNGKGEETLTWGHRCVSRGPTLPLSTQK